MSTPLPDRGWRVPLLVTLVALALRLAVAIEAPPVIAFFDGQEYEAEALSLLHGHGYGGFVLRPPGYPTVMAAVWSVTGHHLLALRIVEALIGALAVGFLTRVGMRRFGATAGAIAGAIAAFHPVLVLLPSTQYCENTLFTLMIGVYACVFAGLDARGRGVGWWVAAGALMGIACLWRPNVVLIVPGLLLASAVLLARHGRPALAPAALFVLTMVLTLTPWTLRNHHAFGRWYFVAIGGGRALWLGNNSQLGPGHYRNYEPTGEFAARLAQAPTVFDQDDLLRAEGWREIRRDPARAASLYGLRLGVLMALWPETQTRTRWMIDAARWAQGVLSVFVYVGVLLALGRLGRVPPMIPLLVGTVGFLLGTALFFTTMRYRVPVEPVFLWMSGIGWASLRERRGSVTNARAGKAA